MRITAEREQSCQYRYDHTPDPEGYLEWHAWAKAMSKTHKQRKCSGCNLYVIWEPKKPRASKGVLVVEGDGK